MTETDDWMDGLPHSDRVDLSINPPGSSRLAGSCLRTFTYH